MINGAETTKIGTDSGRQLCIVQASAPKHVELHIMSAIVFVAVARARHVAALRSFEGKVGITFSGVVALRFFIALKVYTDYR